MHKLTLPSARATLRVSHGSIQPNFGLRPSSQVPGEASVDDWKLYRTRFLAKARRLTQPCAIIDGSGRRQEGKPGDYLVEAADGSQRITPAAVFEDVYVELEPIHYQRRTASKASRRPPFDNKQVYNMLWLPIDKYH